ncbi:MAG: hypothetical protein BJ554DRAFT_739 [Olpidium bornovanus]|uniref:Uncharacterized protein n=1 Tax=Olpidium bornovanus TaxID=278681 RepID=A0A8H8DHX1_9FUNG|nr:MAG: hypothetical protein BJ554DRAFT_739 [Olpidium bornovanus]
MDHIFTEAYIRSTYSSALLGIGMPRSSLRRALSACAESSFEMDITAFLNARHLAILRKEFGDLTSDDEDVQNRFFREIQTHFLPVRVHDDEGEDEGTYCFLPASVKPLIRPPGPTDQCDSQAIISSILRLQSEPMFVRLECTYGRGDTFVRTKVGCLPLSYTCDVGGSHRNFTPSRIGCRGSPLESADGTRAVMHIVCLTLSPLMGSPREGPWRPAGPWAGESCQDEEHIGDSSLAQTGMPSPGESERGFHAPLSPTEAIAEA